MVGASKTLKVTYGSFSCTLEGFDDPVAALKSVTAHLQSISAPQPLFAAETAVPDAEVLLRATGPEAGVRTVDASPATSDPSSRDRDADVSRLLSQTIGQMEGEDQRRRRTTIGHLKAAVAVTADDPGAATGDDPARQERYRADLARLMRPGQLPGPGLMPGPDRPLPLLLAPELRVTRPRRAGEGQLPDATVVEHRPEGRAEPVAEKSEAPPAQSPAAGPPDFADFAARMGAVALPELIEAAAAFIICTGGSASFTRPALMRHLSSLPDGRGGTPEDQMRGFGRLLRDGRVLRAEGGTFVLPADAPVMDRAHRLAG